MVTRIFALIKNITAKLEGAILKHQIGSVPFGSVMAVEEYQQYIQLICRSLDILYNICLTISVK